MENSTILYKPKTDDPLMVDGQCEKCRCQWCNELYPMSELHEETDLGLLCDNCIMAIESRGETLNLKS